VFCRFINGEGKLMAQLPCFEPLERKHACERTSDVQNDRHRNHASSTDLPPSTALLPPSTVLPPFTASYRPLLPPTALLPPSTVLPPGSTVTLSGTTGK